MTPADRQAIGALLDAISHHLPIAGPGPEQDVRLACACITGGGLNLDEVAGLTLLLNGTTLPPGHGDNHVDGTGRVVSAAVPGECITCHGHVDAGGTFHPAAAS